MWAASRQHQASATWSPEAGRDSTLAFFVHPFVVFRFWGQLYCIVNLVGESFAARAPIAADPGPQDVCIRNVGCRLDAAPGS
jgi:hypothetical protein